MKQIFNILLVDDDHFISAYLGAEMEKQGYRVVIAENGREAEEAIAFYKFDVVITDIFMPQMDGIELIQILRKRFPNIPVFALSGGGRFSRAEDFLGFARRFGAVEVFTKPVELTALMTKLEKYCPQGAQVSE